MANEKEIMTGEGSSLGASLLRAALFALAVACAEWAFFLVPFRRLSPVELAALRYASVAMMLVTGSLVGFSTFKNAAAMLRPHGAGRCPGPAAIVGLATMVAFLLVFWNCVIHFFMAVV